MKRISLALAGLLSISSIPPCVAENTEQSSFLAPDKSLAALFRMISDISDASTVTSISSSPIEAGGGSAIRRIHAPPLQNMAEAKLTPEGLPISAPSSADSRALAEEAEKQPDKDKYKDKDKGKTASVPEAQKETVFKEMVVTGQM